VEKTLFLEIEPGLLNPPPDSRSLISGRGPEGGSETDRFYPILVKWDVTPCPFRNKKAGLFSLEKKWNLVILE